MERKDEQREALRKSYMNMLKMPFSDKEHYRQALRELDELDAEERSGQSTRTIRKDEQRESLRQSYLRMLKMPFSDKEHYRQALRELDELDSNE